MRIHAVDARRGRSVVADRRMHDTVAPMRGRRSARCRELVQHRHVAGGRGPSGLAPSPFGRVEIGTQTLAARGLAGAGDVGPSVGAPVLNVMPVFAGVGVAVGTWIRRRAAPRNLPRPLALACEHRHRANPRGQGSDRSRSSKPHAPPDVRGRVAPGVPAEDTGEGSEACRELHTRAHRPLGRAPTIRRPPTTPRSDGGHPALPRARRVRTASRTTTGAR